MRGETRFFFPRRPSTCAAHVRPTAFLRVAGSVCSIIPEIGDLPSKLGIIMDIEGIEFLMPRVRGAFVCHSWVHAHCEGEDGREFHVWLTKLVLVIFRNLFDRKLID